MWLRISCIGSTPNIKETNFIPNLNIEIVSDVVLIKVYILIIAVCYKSLNMLKSFRPTTEKIEVQ